MCECSHKNNNQILIESLENHYKSCLDQRFHETNERDGYSADIGGHNSMTTNEDTNRSVIESESSSQMKVNVFKRVEPLLRRYSRNKTKKLTTDLDQKLQETNESNDSVVSDDHSLHIVEEDQDYDLGNDQDDDQTIDLRMGNTSVKQRYDLRDKKRKGIQQKGIEDSVCDNGKSGSNDSHSGEDSGDETDSHSNDFFKCEKCDKLFNSNSELKDHYLKHRNECGQTSNTRHKFAFNKRKCDPKDSDSSDYSVEELDSNSIDVCGQTSSTRHKFVINNGKNATKDTDSSDETDSHSDVCGQISSTGHKFAINNGKSDPKDTDSSDNTSDKTDSHSIDVCGQTSSTGHRFVCQYSGCDKSYVDSRDLNIHISSKHTNRRPFECKECLKTFVTKKYLKTHQNIHSKKRKFHPNLKKGWNRNIRCEYKDCYTYFKSKTDLARHTRYHHTTDKRFECTECQRKYLTELQLKEHQKIHLKEEVFQCLVCNRRFDNKLNLQKHESSVHSTDGVILKCKVCPFETRSEGVFKCHISRKHTDLSELTVKCGYEGCPKMFKSRELMLKHTRSVHSKKSFVCDWPGCDFVTHTFHNIGVHKRIHNKQRDLKCDFEGCAKYFSTPRTLLKHRMFHLERFVCPWPECGHRFSDEPSMDRHKNRHLMV